LTEIITDKAAITAIFGWYNMLGYFALASGALTSGFVMKVLLRSNDSNDLFECMHAACFVSVFKFHLTCANRRILMLDTQNWPLIECRSSRTRCSVCSR